jgi:D-3-phosphoglycerate dehydrogenase
MSNHDWKVLLTEDVDRAGIELLSDIAKITTADDYETKESLYADADQFDAIFVRTSEITKELIDSTDKLKIISKHGTGLDNIDITAASEHGVLVSNTPHINASAVMEHTITLLLAVRKQLLAADKDIRRGKWDRSGHISYELHGDTLGLFGCGAIGSRVGKAVQSLGMECIAYDPYINESELSEEITMVAKKEKLFKAADLISIHTPLTHETHHEISTKELSHLPDKGIVVNTSRGGIIDQDALVAALDAGELAGAGLDVFADEPPSPDDPLLEFDTVIATPHIGGSTVEALRQMSIDAASNIQTVYEGKIPDSAVNPDEVEPP